MIMNEKVIIMVICDYDDDNDFRIKTLSGGVMTFLSHCHLWA